MSKDKWERRDKKKKTEKSKIPQNSRSSFQYQENAEQNREKKRKQKRERNLEDEASNDYSSVR